MSPATIRNHVQNIPASSARTAVFEAVAYANRHRLISAPRPVYSPTGSAGPCSLLVAAISGAAMPSGRLAAALEVLAVATRLGLTSFGGPIAHLGYFRRSSSVRRRWLDERTYADLVALCQFLPGPASSQVGIAIGIVRAGLLGALAAWLGFTLPSAIALVAVRARHPRARSLRGRLAARAQGRRGRGGGAGGVGHGAQLCPDRERASLAVLAALIVTAWPTARASAGHRRRRASPACACSPGSGDAGRALTRGCRSGAGWASRPSRCSSPCWSPCRSCAA